MSDQTPLDIVLTYQLHDILGELDVDQVVYLAGKNGISFIDMLMQVINVGLAFETVIDKKQRKKEKNQKKERNNNNIIYNKKTKKFSLKDLSYTKSKISPLEAKEAAKKSKRKKPKVSMPKKWVDDREAETISDQILIDYAEKKGYDWYATKEMFLAFVDHHLKNGNKWADWYRAFYSWIRNDIKWNGNPGANVQKSVVRSYKKADNPLGEIFDG